MMPEFIGSIGSTSAERTRLLESIIEEVVKPNAAVVDSQGVFPRDSIDALAAAGFLALTVPRSDGGIGATATEFSDIVFKLARACASTAMVYVMHATALCSLTSLPDSPRRSRFLDMIVRQRALVTEAISEPGSGSQWWSVSSTAEQIPGGYRVVADKSFATSAGYADIYIVSTRTPGASDDRDHAIFAIRADEGEIKAGQWQGLGLAGNSSTWMTFRCDVDDDALLYSGEGGAGLRQYNEVNQPLYHLGVSSAYLGIATAAYDAALERIRSRKYAGNPAGFGSALSQYPIARRHVGEMAIKVEATRSMLSSLARQIDAGCSLDEVAVLMTACKVAAAQAAADVAHEAMLASGGVAYSRGVMPIERHVRDALAASLMGPNDDFCKELIGRLEIDGSSYHDL